MIKSLMPKGKENYYTAIAGQNHFYCGFDRRGKFETAEELTLCQIVLKLEECITAINSLCQENQK